MKKSIALLVSCVLLVLTLFASCGKKEENLWLLNLNDGEKEIAAALTVGDEEISYDFFRYWYLSFKEEMHAENPQIDWSKKENKDKLLELTVNQIKHAKAIEDLAKKYGFELDDEEKAEVDSEMESVFNGAGGADAFKEALAKKFLTPEIYERVLTTNKLQTALLERLVGTDKKENKIVVSFEEALKDFNKAYVRLALVGFDVDIYDDKGAKVDEKTFEARKKEVKAEADKAYEKLKNGDFLTLMKDYYEESEEINLQYYFPIENLNKIFNIDFSKYEVGAVTEPLFSDPAYFILYRMENDAEYLKKNPQAYIMPYYAEKIFDEEIASLTESYKVTTTEDYSLVSPDTIK